MPACSVQLLGAPQVTCGGTPALAPRGRKAWAVLAYLVLAAHPVPRARLAQLVFADADDPLGALRWTLGQLRRTLGPGTIHGDPLVLALPDESTVDVLALEDSDPDPALVRGELLEGVDPNADPAFDAWLLVERRRIAGLGEGILRDGAHRALATGHGLDAAALATRALALAPYDESSHELLVRCLVGAGELGAARHHVRASEMLFQRELGRPAAPRIRAALTAEPAGGAPPAGDRAAALGQLEAGRQALAAGAVEPGVVCLRMARAEAAALGDHTVLAQASAALGTALVHAVRGRDEEGALALHEALVLAEETEQQALIVVVCGELGYIDLQAGRGASAGRWFQRAAALARSDAELAPVLGFRGMALTDRAHYPAALDLLGRSIDAARRCRDGRQLAWSLTLLGRALLLLGRRMEAATALDEALTTVQAEGWVAFQPLPEVLRAEVALGCGDLRRADALLDHAYILSRRLGDPCWEAVAQRGRGLLCAAVGEEPATLARLHDAAAAAARVADRNVWVHAYCLEALAGAEIRAGEPGAASTLTALEHIAARCDMRELVVRAAVHRERLGDTAPMVMARGLAQSIANPELNVALAAV